MPPRPHSEPCCMVSQRSSSWARFACLLDTLQDAVDDFHAARRTDAAGRALAAGLDRTEFHRVARHAGHVDGVVEGDDAAVAHERTDRSEGFVIERRVELRLRQVGAERAADLHRTQRAPRGRTAAEVVEQLTERDAECLFDQSAVLEVAGQLDRQRAARATHAEVAVVRRAALENDRHRGQRNHVVDDGGLAEQALDRRQGRAVAHLGALAFEAFEQRGFLAADVGAGAHAHFELEGLAAAAARRGRGSHAHARPRSLHAGRGLHADTRSAGRCSPWWRRPRCRRWSSLRPGTAGRLPSASDPRTCPSRLRPRCRRRTSAASAARARCAT